MSTCGPPIRPSSRLHLLLHRVRPMPNNQFAPRSHPSLLPAKASSSVASLMPSRTMSRTFPLPYGPALPVKSFAGNFPKHGTDGGNFGSRPPLSNAHGAMPLVLPKGLSDGTLHKGRTSTASFYIDSAPTQSRFDRSAPRSGDKVSYGSLGFRALPVCGYFGMSSPKLPSGMYRLPPGLFFSLLTPAAQPAMPCARCFPSRHLRPATGLVQFLVAVPYSPPSFTVRGRWTMPTRLRSPCSVSLPIRFLPIFWAA